MTSGTAVYDAGPTFGLYELVFRPSNPEQLSVPIIAPGSGIASFDSTFDITYDAVVGVGLAPPFPVSGVGTAHVVGTALPGPLTVLGIYFFETEVLSLDLEGLPDDPSFMFRESPTLDSVGVIRVSGNPCYAPICTAEARQLRISSFFEVNTEITFDGGATWTPAREGASIHIEQIPEPTTAALAALGGAMTIAIARRRGRT
jgi:hypothetical protein